jgi:hypothetical protein
MNACNGNMFVMKTYPPTISLEEEEHTPRGDHVKVEQGRESTPKCRASFQSSNPEEESEHKQEDRNGLIII